MVSNKQTGDVDVVILHVGTNHLWNITDDIRHLEKTLDLHRELIQKTKEVYGGLPVVVSGIFPRYDE